MLTKSMTACVYAALTLLPTASALAATVEQDVTALAGQWQGEAANGTKVTVQLAKGQGEQLATGSLKIEGGLVQDDKEFTLLRTDKLFWMVPGKTPFDAEKDEPYAMTRLPDGGLKFVRLAHPGGDAASLQAEEIEIGRLSHTGTRSFKLIRSEKLCNDPAAPGGKPCGEPVTETIVLHKAQ